MQIVIDIPEEIINMCKDNEVTTVKLSAEYFRNGTPLPKGHGRLGDLDIFKKELEKYWNERKGLCYADIESIVDLLVPTALKAENDMRGDTDADSN